MLKLFQTGRSHMAVLLQPDEDEEEVGGVDGEGEGDGEVDVSGRSVAGDMARCSGGDPEASGAVTPTAATPVAKRGAGDGSNGAAGVVGGSPVGSEWDGAPGGSVGRSGKGPQRR